jgi:glycosyltransferase involved in cell wall biosynthesis
MNPRDDARDATSIRLDVRDVEPGNGRRRRLDVSDRELGSVADNDEGMNVSDAGEGTNHGSVPKPRARRRDRRGIVAEKEDSQRENSWMNANSYTTVAVNRLRLAMYTDSHVRGGAEMSLRTLVGRLGDDIDLTLMGVDRPMLEWLADPRPATRTVVVPPIPGKRAIGAMLATRRAFQRLRPAVVHLNLVEMADAQYALLAALSVRGTRVVAVEQLPLPPTNRLSRWLKHQTSRRLAAHVAVGEAAARIVEREARAAPGSVRTIHNGVPDAELVPVTRPGPGIVVGCLARLHPVKGLDVLLDAVAPLPDVRVLVVGDGPARAGLEAQAVRLGMVDRLHLPGFQANARDYLTAMDLFVLPSRAEGFPLSILEAMLAELPVVATPVGSVPEAVVEGETGLLVAPGDADRLSSAIAHLATDEQLRQRFGAEGRRRAAAEFTDTHMADAYRSLYEELVPG